MAEANQFTVTHKQLVELIIKDAGIHEGRWFLMVNFGLAPGSYGPTPEQAVPGIVVGIQQLGIQRETGESKAALGGVVVDAAEVNPKPSSKADLKKAPHN
jgi:hypothetical protein